MRFGESIFEPRHAVLDFDLRSPADHDGGHAPSEALFYHSGLEDQTPENRLLRLINMRVSFEFVGEQLKGS